MTLRPFAFVCLAVPGYIACSAAARAPGRDEQSSTGNAALSPATKPA